MMITFESKGEFKNTKSFLKRVTTDEIFKSLHRYAIEGVKALAMATPQDSGLTAISWDYEIVDDGKSISIIWNNDHVVDGRPIAVLIQYGHGTGTGGYVVGRDYINPALRPIFDRIAEEIWREVTTS